MSDVRIVLKDKKMYEFPFDGGSVTGSLVKIVGEATAVVDDDEYECYLYEIIGHRTKNGEPFVARKENIIVFG